MLLELCVCEIWRRKQEYVSDGEGMRRNGRGGGQPSIPTQDNDSTIPPCPRTVLKVLTTLQHSSSALSHTSSSVLPCSSMCPPRVCRPPPAVLQPLLGELLPVLLMMKGSQFVQVFASHLRPIYKAKAAFMTFVTRVPSLCESASPEEETRPGCPAAFLLARGARKKERVLLLIHGLRQTQAIQGL